MCSRFVVVNAPRLDEVWTLTKETPMKSISKAYRNQRPNNQLLFRSVKGTHPEEVNVLADGWDMTVTNRWKPEFLPIDEKFPDIGMLHLNGGGNQNKEAYFNLSGNFYKKFPGTWGEAQQYVTTPWTWARCEARSLVRPHEGGIDCEFARAGRTGGHELVLVGLREVEAACLSPDIRTSPVETVNSGISPFFCKP